PLAPSDPRLARAEQAEREGRVGEAIDLYSQLGQSMANTDYQLAVHCYNRANALRRGNPSVAQTRLHPVPAGTVSQSAAAYAPQTCCTACGQNEYAFRGRLREAYQSLDRKPTYALENAQGQPVAYVTPAGVDLKAHVNQFVEVSGVACYRGDVRA